MRTFLIGEKDLSRQAGRPMTCEYRILVNTLPPPVCCESYGIRVAVCQTGEAAEVPDITVLPGRIEALALLLYRGGVTPCTVREVVEDWLA